MTNNFQLFKLGSVASVIAGGDKPRNFSEIKTGNFQIPVFANGETNEGLQGYTDQARIDKPAVTVSARGTIGYAVLRKEPFVPIVRLLALIPDSQLLDVTYLYYYLRLYRQSGLGSSQAQLIAPELANRTISMPSLKLQKLISKILATLDDKIAHNNKINAELEKTARLIYDYWFTQFDFPDENGKPYKSSGGTMIFNKQLKKEVPASWKIVCLRDLIEVSKNGDWGSEKDSDGSIKVYCVRGADINGLNGLTTFSPTVRYIKKSHSSSLLKANDLIIEISGGSPTQSTGRMAHISNDVIERLQNKVVCSNFCKAISFKDERKSYIVNQYWDRLYESGIFFNFEGKTSGIKNLMFDQLAKDVKIALPQERLLIDRYYDIASLIDSQKQINLLQNQELAQLRDWLLPMLMTDQVKVAKDA